MQQEDALEVFVRFNSGGKALAKSDISMAILESYWPSSKTEFGTVLQDSYADFGTDFIIRTALMLYANVVKSNISKNTAMTLKNDWENFKQTLIKLEKLLKSFNIEVSRFSSSWNVLLPIIYAIHYNPDYTDNAEEIKIYLLRAVLFTYFQSGTTGKLNILKNMLNEYDRKFDRLWLDNNIRALELNDAKIEDILNSQKKDTGERTYGSNFKINVLYNELCKLKYPFLDENLKKIRERVVPQRLAFQIRVYPNVDRTLDFAKKKKEKK